MDPQEALNRLGGVADFGTLSKLCGRRAIERAVRGEAISRDGRGRYSLSIANDALRAASALSGVVSHTSAALHWGWEVKTVPRRPHVTIGRSRTPTRKHQSELCLHWATLGPGDVVDRVTSPGRTLVDCLRSLPGEEALAVADSALRHRAIGREGLARIAEGITGPGARRARTIAAAADGRAANPFESVLRAISLEVPGLRLVPQLSIQAADFSARPDLVDPALRVVAEADSQTWHNANRSQLRRDCRRYTGLVARGWLVGRFAWEDVMFEPGYVRSELTLLRDRAHRGA
ncbi:MAG: hypothetical protein ACJ72O_04990 [Marmoricola sp.]